MRGLNVTLIAMLLAGCATAPVPDKAAVYDREHNTYTYRYGPRSERESADANRDTAGPAKAQPGWYRFGHP